jgi:hypothetical protein
MSKDKDRKAQQVGRVDFRLLMDAKSSQFEDKRTKRARTRNAAERRAIDEELN